MFPGLPVGEYRALGSGLTNLEVCKRIARYAKGSIFNVMIELIEPMSETTLVSVKLWGYRMPTRDNWTFGETY
jgi:hypothetical protein